MGVIYLTEITARLRLKTGPEKPVDDFKCVIEKLQVIPKFILTQHAVMSLSGLSVVV